MIPIDVLRGLSLQDKISDTEGRMLIMYYIYYNTGMLVGEVMSAIIRDQPQFDTNLQTAKAYFGSFIIENKLQENESTS